MTTKSSFTLEGVESELKEVEEQLAGYKELIQRQADLQQMRTLMLRLAGQSIKAAAAVASASSNGSSNGHREARGTSDAAEAVLRANGPLLSVQLILKMREIGWECSGNDAIDWKRAYVAMFRLKEKFERLNDGRWRLKE